MRRKAQKNKVIYLDNAATTPTKEEVVKEMLPYFTNIYSNPSAVYGFAGKSVVALDNARRKLAEVMGAKPEEIYFTGGGSESDNWALKAAAEDANNKGKHIITSKIEHHAVLNTCRYLETKGYDVTYLGVDESGCVSTDELKDAIREDTFLISIMMANNEVGTIQPVADIGQIAREKGILFHTDAVQAYGHIPINVNDMSIDMLSASAHKFGGPKGVGFLYVKKNVKLSSFIHGGGQERGKRAGTYNVPGIVGMGKAAELAAASLQKNIETETMLRDRLIERVLSEIPDVKLNGSHKKRLPGNANFCFKGVQGESLLILLDQKHICVSSGSACTSGSLDPSHVLMAMGLSDESASSSLRITLSSDNTPEQIDYVVDELKTIVSGLRN